jgi:SAM-dependent methyltransferase
MKKAVLSAGIPNPPSEVVYMPVPVHQTDIEELRAYYEAQAEWTAGTRSYLYRRTNILKAREILEVGCGTGEITAELLRRTSVQITAVDVSEEAVAFTRRRCPDARVVRADAAQLDFDDGTFDAAVCHFTLMWCAEPQRVVAEMARVVRRSGCVLAMAEPDYGGIVEYPDSINCGRMIAEGLHREGADPLTGRKIPGMFRAAGLETEVGLASAVWDATALKGSLRAHRWLVKNAVSEDEFTRVQYAQDEALKRNEVVFFLPVFWACGLR